MRKKRIFVAICIFVAIAVTVWAIIIVKNIRNKQEDLNILNQETIEEEEDYTQSLLSATEQYKSIDLTKVQSVQIISSSGVKYKTKVLTDSEEIKDLYTKLGQIKLKEKTEKRTSNDDLTVRFIFNSDVTISFFFEQNNIIIKSSQYETDGLTRIKIILSD